MIEKANLQRAADAEWERKQAEARQKAQQTSAAGSPNKLGAQGNSDKNAGSKGNSDGQDNSGGPENSGGQSGSNGGSNDGKSNDASTAAAANSGPATTSDSDSKYEVIFLYPTGTPNRFSFTKTKEAQEAFDMAHQKYQNETCAMTTLDKITSGAALLGMGGALFGDGSDIGKGASAASTGAGLANGAATAFGSGCEAELAALEAQRKELLEIAKKDSYACLKAEYGNTTTECAKITVPIAREECELTGHAANKARCEKVKANAEIAAETTMGWIKKHAISLASTLAAVGAGAMGLMSSGDDVRDDNKTVAGAIIAEKCKKKADGTFKDPKAATDPECNLENKTQTTTDDDESKKTATNEIGNQSCSGELKPLECYVTTQCNLNCVASNFGVSNYGGKDKDGTRIDGNGKAVNTLSSQGSGGSGNLANTSNSGSGSGSSLTGGGGGGGGSSGGGSGTEVATNDTLGRSPSSDYEMNNALKNFSGFDTSGLFGGSDSYGGGSSSSKEDGSTSGGSRNGKGALTAVEAYRQAVVSGPIGTPHGSTLFQNVNKITAGMALKGLVLP